MIDFVISALGKIAGLAVPISLIVMGLTLDFNLVGLVILGLIWMTQLGMTIRSFRQLRFELTGTDDLVRFFIMDTNQGAELSNKLVRDDPNETPKDRWFNVHQFGCACVRLGAEAAITQERVRYQK